MIELEEYEGECISPEKCLTCPDYVHSSFNCVQEEHEICDETCPTYHSYLCCMNGIMQSDQLIYCLKDE